jgi:hypothetical protein
VTNRAYAKSNGDGLLCSILWHGRYFTSLMLGEFQRRSFE